MVPCHCPSKIDVAFLVRKYVLLFLAAIIITAAVNVACMLLVISVHTNKYRSEKTDECRCRNNNVLE